VVNKESLGKLQGYRAHPPILTRFSHRAPGKVDCRSRKIQFGAISTPTAHEAAGAGALTGAGSVFFGPDTIFVQNRPQFTCGPPCFSNV